jgi:hypothetical protein
MATRREFASAGRRRTRLVRAVATGFALSISVLCAGTTASGQTPRIGTTAICDKMAGLAHVGETEQSADYPPGWM